MRNADTVRGLNRGIGRPLPRYTSLESGVMRKYHAPFGGRPTEKGSNQEYLAGGPPYPVPSWFPHNLYLLYLLKRFRSCTVISIASNEHPLCTSHYQES